MERGLKQCRFVEGISGMKELICIIFKFVLSWWYHGITIWIAWKQTRAAFLLNPLHSSYKFTHNSQYSTCLLIKVSPGRAAVSDGAMSLLVNKVNNWLFDNKPLQPVTFGMKVPWFLSPILAGRLKCHFTVWTDAQNVWSTPWCHYIHS